MPRLNATPAERLAAYLVEMPNGCMEWTRSGSWFGYGLMKINYKNVPTHRLAWELTNGPIPAGLCVLHKCDNPPCCNPDHLELGTIADNNRQKAERGRANKGRLHDACKRGHRLTGRNVIDRPNGGRQCRTCTYESNRRYKERAGR